MLGKIAFFEANDRPDITADRARVRPALLHHLQSAERNADLTTAAGGTLGLCFDAELAGTKRFLKAHLPGETARASLALEGDILGRLYGQSLLLDRFEFSLDDGTRRLCLLMRALTPLPAPLPAADASALIRACTDRFESWHPGNLPSFEVYLTVAGRAVQALSHRHLLDEASASETCRLLRKLDDSYPDLPRAFCHGDLGPKNIMCDGGERYVIDWEDAFLGVAGYDYLYWLTFMENRPFLQTAAFGRTGLAPDVERAILVLVVLLKSYLAVLSGAYLTHALTPQARIAEMLALR